MLRKSSKWCCYMNYEFIFVLYGSLCVSWIWNFTIAACTFQAIWNVSFICYNGTGIGQQISNTCTSDYHISVWNVATLLHNVAWVMFICQKRTATMFMLIMITVLAIVWFPVTLHKNLLLKCARETWYEKQHIFNIMQLGSMHTLPI